MQITVRETVKPVRTAGAGSTSYFPLMAVFVITAGGMKEPIDKVRSIVNSSRGTLGAMIAQQVLKRDDVDAVIYICGPGSVQPGSVQPASDERLEVIPVSTAFELQDAVNEVLQRQHVDYFVHSMAVADYHVKGVWEPEALRESLEGQAGSSIKADKVSSASERLFIELAPNPKIIDQIRVLSPRTFLVGFKLLHDVQQQELFDVGFNLLRRARCNMILANDLASIRQGHHDALLIYPEKRYDVLVGKAEIAEQLVQAMVTRASVRHTHSIQSAQTHEVDDHTVERFHAVGQALAVDDLLPRVEGGTYGNMSERLAGDGFIITGRNVDKTNIVPERLVHVRQVEDDDDPSVYAHVHYLGSVKPSIDAAIHALVYRSRPDINALVHVHTPAIFAELALTAHNWPCGSDKEAQEIVEGFSQGGAVVQMHKHGLIAGSNDLQGAYEALSRTLHLPHIRPMTSSDEDQAAYAEYQEHKQEVFQALIDVIAARYCWMYESGGEVQGVVFWRHVNGVLEFVLYSLLSVQGKGQAVGRHVLQILETIARAQGLKHLDLLTTHACGVEDYYLAQGFRHVERADLIRMRCDL